MFLAHLGFSPIIKLNGTWYNKATLNKKDAAGLYTRNAFCKNSASGRLSQLVTGRSNLFFENKDVLLGGVFGLLLSAIAWANNNEPVGESHCKHNSRYSK